MSDPTGHPIESAEHALRTGAVWGLAAQHGLILRPLFDDNSDYTATAELVMPAGGFLAGVSVFLVVLPPTDVPT